MLRYKQTEPGLVAFYNIRPGKKTAGLFLQPRSLHRAYNVRKCMNYLCFIQSTM